MGVKPKQSYTQVFNPGSVAAPPCSSLQKSRSAQPTKLTPEQKFAPANVVSILMLYHEMRQGLSGK